MNKKVLVTCLMIPFFLASCSSNGSGTNENQYSITISEKAITLQEEDTYQLTAESTRKGGLIFWSMRDENIAIVSDNGLVTGVKEGTTVCYAKSGKEVAMCTVVVTPYNAKDDFAITLEKTSFSLNVGDMFDLPIHSLYGSEEVIPSYIYEISDETVFSVSNTTINALAKGHATAVITANYLDKTANAWFEVTVY